MKIFGWNLERGAGDGGGDRPISLGLNNPEPQQGRAFSTTSPEAIAFFSGRDAAAGQQMLDLHGAWGASVWVRKCIDSLSQSISRLPFELYRDQTQIDQHELLTLIERPSPWMTPHNLWYMTVAMLQLYGECFWLLLQEKDRGRIEGSRPGFPNRVYILHPRRVKEKLTDNRRDLMAWTISLPGGEHGDVLPEEIVHFKIPNPLNEWRGASPLSVALLAASADVAAQRHNMGVFERGAIPSGVLVTSQRLNPMQADQIVARFEARHRESHRPAILHSGLEYIETQMSQRDMEFRAAREMNREEILAAFGVPPIEVGLLQYASYANAKEQRKAYWERTLIPLATLVTDAIRQQLIRDDSLEPWFNTDGVEELREDLETKAVTAQKFFGMSVPFNRINERLELGFDPLPWGDEGFLTSTLAPASMFLEPPEEEEPPPPTTEEETPEEEVAPEEENPEEETQAGFSVAQPQAMTPVSGANVAPRTFDWNVIAKKITRRPRAEWPEDEGTTRASMDDKLDKILKLIEKDEARLTELSEKFITEAVTLGIAQMAELIEVGNFDLANPTAIEFIEQKTILITRISETTRERVRQIVKDGIASGASVEDIADAIRADYNFGPDRARTIARTETASSVNGARYLTLEAEKVEAHEWINARDKAVRASHHAEGGHVVKVGKRFPVTELTYPGEPTGKAEEVINCRCLTLPAEIARKMNSARRDLYWHEVFGRCGQDDCTLDEGRAVTPVGLLERRFAKALSGHFYRERIAILKILGA